MIRKPPKTLKALKKKSWIHPDWRRYNEYLTAEITGIAGTTETPIYFCSFLGVIEMRVTSLLDSLFRNRYTLSRNTIRHFH